MSAFSHAWDLLKALSPEDLQQAARTGGIGMTPERGQAYADAGLPLNTGGGFRTMPDTEAQRLMRYQKTGSPEGINQQMGSGATFDPKAKDLAEFLHQDSDTGGNLDMDDRLEDIHYMLTQGQSIEPHSEPDAPPEHPMKEYLAPMPKGRGVSEEYQKRTAASNRGAIDSYRNNQKEGNERDLREYLNQLPENERFPPSEFARRGDAGASASDKAFSEMKNRQQRAEAEKQRAEAEKQMLAERQKEMMMRQQKARMKSKQPPKGRAGGRRPGEGKNAYKNRMRRQGGRR